ncbi:MAG: DUF1508 domain-containing protein [Ignavibacteriae bacterium]|nr:DUF1508 domain-containing protein [Ignavibacteriota bacterium]
MIQLSDYRWEFYQDKINQWQWRKFVANKVVAVSSDSYYSRQACVNDARKRGYVGPIVRSPRALQ